ncbi:hypothetical protein FVE85_4777 [Porphyridium purpureum]|uniref:Uncharacterized protein n=1 Tax=Porphyridium purpureum TaxID=35688 RepID=A0A5J4YRW2_PORPP|nr:hypothetical protein FVE85_4777 [Porphyridium purpureum]|eukprot:POR1859..scf236_6
MAGPEHAAGMELFDFQQLTQERTRTALERARPRRVCHLVFASWDENWALVLTSRSELLAFDFRDTLLAGGDSSEALELDRIARHRIQVDVLEQQEHQSGSAPRSLVFGRLLSLAQRTNVLGSDRLCVITDYSITHLDWDTHGFHNLDTSATTAHAPWSPEQISQARGESFRIALAIQDRTKQRCIGVATLTPDNCLRVPERNAPAEARLTLGSVLLQAENSEWCDSPIGGGEVFTCVVHGPERGYFVGTSLGRVLHADLTTESRILRPLFHINEAEPQPVTDLALDTSESFLYVIVAGTSLYAYQFAAATLFRRDFLGALTSLYFPSVEAQSLIVLRTEGDQVLLADIDHAGFPRMDVARRLDFTYVRSVALNCTGRMLALAGPHPRCKEKRDAISLYGSQSLRWWSCCAPILL